MKIPKEQNIKDIAASDAQTAGFLSAPYRLLTVAYQKNTYEA